MEEKYREEKKEEIIARAKKVIEKYGVSHQLKKFNEETYELVEAIVQLETEFISSNKAKSFFNPNDFCLHLLKRDLKNHVVEEIGDVLFLLIQIIEYYKIEDFELEKCLDFKSKRTLDRMKIMEMEGEKVWRENN